MTAVVSTATVTPSAGATATLGSPPNQTDHGLDTETFSILWSGDRDQFIPPEEYEGPSRSALAVLANGTDIPLDEPPIEVEQWNRGDIREYPTTDRRRSVYPSDARLRDRTFLKDATANIFAVQPSTRARLTSGEQPLYIRPSGQLLGAVDYRIEIPEPTGPVGERTIWEYRSSSIEEVRLLVDDTVVSRQDGAQVVEFEYEGLDSYRSDDLTLSLTADIEADLTKITERCTNRSADGDCTEVIRDREAASETLTVRDTLDVSVYDLSISGYRAKYPNGDLGLVVYKSDPWLGHTVPNGDVNGVWRFYTARDQDWDVLTRSDADGHQTIRSPSQPLQVSAFPIETGPSVSPRANVTLLETYGETTSPPTLPDAINLDSLTEPYEASFGIATRTRTTDHDLSNVIAKGLVRGTTVEAEPSSFAEMSIYESNLTLEVLDRESDSVRIKLSLRENATGKPIETAQRDGYVVLAGERFNTTENGTVIATLPRANGAFSARYVPSFWWWNTPGYTPDSDVVYARGTILEWFGTLFRFAVPVSMFLVGVFLIDRITGWDVWPPWRGV
ncbi:hypothetical protein [Halorientalis salina]|uniref:hypothetical protein n=1 Tax=Halorientalis salina TaxID=2932266 RepID=UPI0010ABDA9C|nr:hypothetical protein [Halorientalis salina]